SRTPVLRHPHLPDDDLLSDGRLLRTYESSSPRRLGLHQGPDAADRAAARSRLADRARGDGSGRDLGRGVSEWRSGTGRSQLTGAAEIFPDPSLVPLCPGGSSMRQCCCCAAASSGSTGAGVFAPAPTASSLSSCEVRWPRRSWPCRSALPSA